VLVVLERNDREVPLAKERVSSVIVRVGIEQATDVTVHVGIL